MANFFNLTLDTLAPVISSFVINAGAAVTTSPQVTLTILAEEAASMKIWGIAGAETEAQASWEAFAQSKQVNLSGSADGSYTVHVKVRDAVYNESNEASDSITLSSSLPGITVTGPDVSVISKVDGKNVASFTFRSDVALKAWKVKLVPSSSSVESAGTLIGSTGGSTGMSGGILAANTAQSCTITGVDLSTAAGGTDGTYIIKVFGQSAENDLWSA